MKDVITLYELIKFRAISCIINEVMGL